MRCLFVDEDDVNQNIPPTFDDLLDDIIGIGKYRDKTFNWILDYDTSYIAWMLETLPSNGRAMMQEKHHQLLVVNRKKMIQRCEESRKRINRIEDTEYKVQFKYKNQICTGSITEIEPNKVLDDTKLKLRFDFAERKCGSHLQSHTITRLYKDLLINGNEYDPPPIRNLYIRQNIDTETLKAVNGFNYYTPE